MSGAALEPAAADEKAAFESVARGTNRKGAGLWHEDAERAVLAAMLLSADAAMLVRTLLQPAMFYRTGHQALFTAMLRVQADGMSIDPLTVAAALEAAGTLAVAGGKTYLGGLLDEIPTAANVQYHAALVRQYAERRQLRRLGQELAAGAEDVTVGLDDVRDRASRRLLEVISGEEAFGYKPAGVGVRKVIQRLQDIEAGTTTAGLVTGFPELDERLDGGFAPGDLVLIVGVPSSGKTSLMVNILERVAREGHGATALVSAEVTEEIVMRGLLAGIAGVPVSHLKRGELSGSEARAVLAAAAQLERTPFFIDDSDTPAVEDVIVRTTLLKAKEPTLAAVGVDFLQMIQRRDRARGESEELNLERIAYDLKGLAKRLGVVLFAAVQPNDKQIEDREDKRPQVRDIARSSGPRRAADAILLIYRPGQYSPAAGPEMEVNLGKFRTGALGKVDLEWEGPYVRATSKRRRQLELEAERARERPLSLNVGVDA